MTGNIGVYFEILTKAQIYTTQLRAVFQARPDSSDFKDFIIQQVEITLTLPSLQKRELEAVSDDRNCKLLRMPHCLKPPDHSVHI